MKVQLFDFQEEALCKLRDRLMLAQQSISVDNPQVVSFSAPTGAGKTIIMAVLLENILFGHGEFHAQPDAVILWISDSPELNEQTRRKIEGKSDRIRTHQLVTIENSFDAERLEGGHIYFMNTQKLGNEKLLTTKGDQRQHTFWETLSKTAQVATDRFYVVIDEAHRGMLKSKAADKKARTILQRFLLGHPDDGLCRMPLVIGISATPERFDNLLLDSSDHTLHRIRVKTNSVQESGLLKDRTIIHYPGSFSQAEMTLLTNAVEQWQEITKRWADYCRVHNPNEEIVEPILVVQVEDGPGETLTRTDLGTIIEILESTINRPLYEGEVAHTFHGVGEREVNGYRMKYMEASRIEDEKNIRVVLFKMNLSTGWDCPRAEVMMSFRPAKDHTYIAQLLGRMVRAPLARRIDAVAALNDVHLFLPHFDQDTVKMVIEALLSDEDVPPTEIGTDRQLVELHRSATKEHNQVFEALGKLVTYRVNAVRKQSALRRLMKLGRRLAHDSIDGSAQEKVKNDIVDTMAKEVQRLREEELLEEQLRQVKRIDLNTTVVEHGAGNSESEDNFPINLISADIERLFERADQLLGNNGLPTAYWKSESEIKQRQDYDEIKAEVIVLTQDTRIMNRLELFAEEEFNQLYEKHKRAIAKLKEKRKSLYETLRLAASTPNTIPWNLPETIPFRRLPDAQEYNKHLFLEEKDGSFRADLGTWEQEVVMEELADESVIGWLRNVDRQPWSLEIPYEQAGNMKSMYPDLLVVRKLEGSEDYLFDILEPHHPNLDDNVDKAKGLAKFAEKHWDLFDRIELIRKKRGANGEEQYFRLDVGKAKVREMVLEKIDNHQLDRVFDKKATTRD